jgi:hypothetical protein
MSISKALRDGAKLAVFTRNHKGHLDEAFRVSSAEPERLIPFRAVSRWSSAAQALQQHSPIDIYFAVVDSGPLVQYAAKLLRVIVDPQRGQPETEQLLDLSTTTTREEGLWENTGKPAGTLYAINHLERVPQPFSMTELIKVSDNQPISPDYGYSYTLVYAR